VLTVAKIPHNAAMGHEPNFGIYAMILGTEPLYWNTGLDYWIDIFLVFTHGLTGSCWHEHKKLNKQKNPSVKDFTTY